ncbi:hypothetical protein DI43_13610 [Geobacillus sp. CAMR12739]|nr:hypothetical protein DI43_13610 [Geobacillus sp. CAMR12739]
MVPQSFFACSKRKPMSGQKTIYVCPLSCPADGRRWFFDYRGTFRDGEAIRTWLERCEPSPPLRLASFAVGEGELTVELELLTAES